MNLYGNAWTKILFDAEYIFETYKCIRATIQNATFIDLSNL